MVLENISVDCVIFGFDGENLNVLLWQPVLDIIKKFYRNEEDYKQISTLFHKNPFSTQKDVWGLIASHVPVNVDASQHAKHILSSFTSLDNIYLRQVKAFTKTGRVPFQRVITIAYYALINPDFHLMKKVDAVKTLRWFNVKKMPALIFDHDEIIGEALERLRQEVRYHPVGFHLLPDQFTLTQLQTLYETILDVELDTRNFRKKILNMKLLVDTDVKQKNVAHRAAKLYEFNIDIYNQLVRDGLNFRI